MAEQSHRDEMNAAIRAQRERQAAPRTIAPADEAAAATPPPETEQEQLPEPEQLVAPEQPQQPEPLQDAPPRRRSLLDRLRGR